MFELQPLLPLLEQAIGERPSPLKVWRWVNKGIKVGDGRVKLDAKKVGGKFYSTPEAVTSFIRDQNPADDTPDDQPGERSPELQRQLEKAGLA